MSGTLYPGAIDDATTLPPPGPNTVTNAGAVTHAILHDNEILALQALETKVGTGSSTSTTSTVLRAASNGTSIWGKLVLTSDVTATLPVANGGTGVTSFTGTGSNVLSNSPALVTPTGIVKSDVGLNNVDNTSDATKQLAFLAAAYPVGSIYTNVNSTNPATLLGFGTWAAFSAGRVMVGVGTSDQSFTAGTTGGESNHTLTSGESGLPAHFHNYKFGGTAGGDGSALAFASTGSTTSVITAILNATAANASAAHNNLQPYIVVYMWQRTV